MQISRSRPKGMTLPSGDNVGSCSALWMRFARLSARTFSAIDLEMILAAPYCPVPLCLTRRTREQPPRPIVLPSCHGPMCVLRRRLVFEALVLALDMSESRLELWGRASWATTAERRLFSGAMCSSCRTARVPFGTIDSLWGSGFGDEDGMWPWPCLSPRRWGCEFSLARKEASPRARRRVGGRP
jgi:hypothetical protein